MYLTTSVNVHWHADCCPRMMIAWTFPDARTSCISSEWLRWRIGSGGKALNPCPAKHLQHATCNMYLNRALKHPTNWDVWLAGGGFFLARRRTQEGKELQKGETNAHRVNFFSRCTEICPVYTRRWFVLARCRMRMNRHQYTIVSFMSRMSTAGKNEAKWYI